MCVDFMSISMSSTSKVGVVILSKCRVHIHLHGDDEAGARRLTSSSRDTCWIGDCGSLGQTRGYALGNEMKQSTRSREGSQFYSRVLLLGVSPTLGFGVCLALYGRQRRGVQHAKELSTTNDQPSLLLLANA